MALRTITLGTLLLAGTGVSVRGAQSAVHSVVQGVVVASGPPGDTLRELLPTFRLRTAGFSPAERPLVVGLQIATRSDFTGPLLVDTAVVADSAVVTLPRPLPERTRVYWRGRARTAQARDVFSRVTGPREVPARMALVSPDAPLVTLLFQNFPNPFPSRTSATTCIWFNLEAEADVRLEIHDLRGNKARTLVPGPDVASRLAPGRYGRASPDSETGCDQRFAWDGTGDDGRRVPAGVYAVRLRAGATEQYRKILFRGR